MPPDRRQRDPRCPVDRPLRAPTPSSTATPTSRSSTAPRPPTSSSIARSSSGCRRSRSPTTRGSTASSGSRRRPTTRGSIRSSGSSWSSSTRSSRTRPGSWSRPTGRPGAAVGGDRAGRRPGDGSLPGDLPDGGMPVRPRPERTRLPGHRDAVKEDLRGIGEGQRGPHLVLLARDRIGYRSLCRLVSRANLAGTKGVPRFRQALLAEHAEGLVALSGCRDGEIARRLRVGDREGARAVAEGYARLFGRGTGSGSGSAARVGRRRGGGRLRPRARASPPARRRLARGRDRPAGRGARPAGRRHERRPLRAARGPRAPGRRHGDPPRPVGRDAGRSPPTRRGVVPQVRRGADAAAARRSGDGRRRPADGPGLGGGDRGGRRAGGRLRGRPRVRGATASRASRCPAGRRRSRTSPSSATRVPDAATTR